MKYRGVNLIYVCRVKSKAIWKCVQRRYQKFAVEQTAGQHGRTTKRGLLIKMALIGAYLNGYGNDFR